MSTSIQIDENSVLLMVYLLYLSQNNAKIQKSSDYTTLSIIDLKGQDTTPWHTQMGSEFLTHSPIPSRHPVLTD